ncbi:peptidyl-prolyl cis-trans isomerase [Vibrio sp. 404]|uniref:Peptidyl-prolyl cis-trans isomerase n=1 Tax=Vibrio marinisediminis TaxID=2758441 RepID=A0A7W2FUA6_9VIBR|nr:peptidylprolyl isomerase [Vibrio marinisediminis]MBA5764356.1 peptidyl-prolyl cis-trans isomerase [Vibrio marinisediminis]
MIILTTNYGDIEITLDHKKAPETCKNFLRYCEEGFYDNTLFHRIIDGFMIQGGGYEMRDDGFAMNMAEKKTYAPIANEAYNGLKNVTGSIAMARTDAPHSATAQFFINLEQNDFLDHTGKTNYGWGYAVFGTVTAGMDVVNQIAKISTCTRFGHEDMPVSDVVIEKVTVK